MQDFSVAHAIGKINKSAELLFQHQRQSNLRRSVQVQFVISGVFVAFGLVWIGHQYLTIGAGIAAAIIALLLYRASHRPRLVRWGWLCLIVFDIVAYSTLLQLSLSTAEVPRGASVGHMAVLLFVALFSLLALDRWLLVAIAPLIAMLCSMAWSTVGMPWPVRVWGLSLIFLTTWIGFILLGQVGRLINQSAREEVLREKVARYFSPAVRDAVLSFGDDGAKPSQKEITVMFSDLRGFTAMSEKMDSADVAKFLDDYLARMVKLIFAHGGTLDKFMGDGIMAYFGAPIGQPDHAARAVNCAIDTLCALDALNDERKTKKMSPLAMGIGLHTGRAVVGSIGPEERREFTAIGDTVNTASRIENATKDRGVAFLATRATIEAAPKFQWEKLASVSVKGKATPIEVFTLGSKMN